MADFNIEDFLAEDDDDSPAVAQAEADVPDPAPAVEEDVKPSSSPIEANRAPSNSADDFLSWLDDSSAPAQQQRKHSVESNSTKENLMDDFFDEVFGEDTAPSKSASGEVSLAQYRGLDADIYAIVSSSFPDVIKLRGLLLDSGYIPSVFRGQIWLLLLTNACVEDHEAEFWHPSASEEQLVAEIGADCNAAVSKYLDVASTNKGQQEQRGEDMRDILALYCVRREVPYIPYLCDLLSPLLLTPRPLPRALASSCFYALCSEFVPLINLPSAVYDKAVHKVHSWLHLLLSYHFPRLVQHLDRIFPGWEQPISGMSATEAMKQLSQHKQSAGLDEMERELGLEAGEDTSLLSGETTKSGSKPTIHSMRENERRDEGGCIPAAWMSGIFGGTLPPVQTCWLWDWALLNGDRYHGMYATAALLGLYESNILEMSGGQFRTWIKSVVSGSAEWYKTLGSSLFESTEQSNELSWESFTRGWMHAAAAMQRSTPNAFKDALQDTELWAMQDAEDGSSTADETHHTGRANDNHKASLRRSSTTIKQKVGERGTQLLHAVRKFGQQFAESRLRMSDKESAGFAWPSIHERKDDEQWPHDAKNSYWCLWSSVNEVVPSLCTNQRKGSNARSIISYFEDGKNWRKGMTKFGIEMKGGEDMSFPHVKDMSEPFYFGIDIRSDAEKRLGIFPKAFALDPYSLTDPDCVSTFLATLEPLAETAHLCIIGAGEDYLRACGGLKGFGFRRQAAAEGADGQNRGGGSVEEMISDYNLLLTNVAVFFLNKGFRHISIVDGGYAAALKYLVRDDTRFTLSSALVDINPQALDKYLGPGTCDKYLGARKHIEGSRHHHRGSTAGSTSGSSSSDGSSSLPSSVLSSISSVGSFLSSSLSQKQQSSASGGGESNPKQVLEDLGKKFSLFGSTAAAALKKTVAGNSDTVSDGQRGVARNNETRNMSASSLTFVIDSDEEDGGEGTVGGQMTEELKQAPPPQRFTMPDTDKINISRTDAERAQALAIHRLAGLRKGDEVTITKESLPGAILFPATKEKIHENATEEVPFIVVHRYLVVTRERFIVLDSGGKGVGATAKVKSNHHLTELLKITYKKKNPELVTLYLATPGAVEGTERTRQYRVIKRKEFVEALQKNMMRFK